MSAIEAETFRWIFCKQFGDQVGKRVRMGDSHLIWNFERVVDDGFVLALYVAIVEWKHAGQHGVHDGADCPPVSREIVRFLPEDLRGEVGRSADDRIGDLTRSEYLGQPEVYNLEVAVSVHHKVFQLEVPVHQV